MGSVLKQLIFEKEGRSIFLWRRGESIHYNMQGRITVLPTAFRESASVFRGMWTETGAVANFEQALALVKAWLLERAEVDELPQRRTSRRGFA